MAQKPFSKMLFFRIISIAFVTILVIGCDEPAYYQKVESNPEWWQQTKDSLKKVYSPERFATIDYADYKDFPWRSKPEDAFDILLNTNTFASSFVGFGGMPSDQAIAFNVILDAPNPEGAFKNLLERANNAGKLYALSGLYLLDQKLFEKEVTPFIKSQDSVMTLQGCVMDKQGLGQIVKSSNGIKLKKGQSIEEWYDENHGKGWETAEPAELYEYDIMGGAWSKDFLTVKKWIKR